MTSSTTCVSNEKERRKKLKVPVVNKITRKKTKKKKKPKNKGKELSHYSNIQLDAESNSRLLYTAM